MRQMRGENTGPRYRSPCARGRSVRDKLETEAGFMSHIARDKGPRALKIGSTLREMTREATDESCKPSRYPRTSGTQVSINLYVAEEDTRELSMYVHRDTARGIRGFRDRRCYAITKNDAK